MFFVIARAFEDTRRNEEFVVELASLVHRIPDQFSELAFPEVSEERQWRVVDTAMLIPVMTGLAFLVASDKGDVDQALITGGRGDILEIILTVVSKGGMVSDLVIILTKQEKIERWSDIPLEVGGVLLARISPESSEGDVVVTTSLAG